MALVSDLAICKAEDDLLERKEFSNNIADLIAKRESSEAFTVGLMGAWGSGKSSI
ncbi:KAP family NTPase [Acinetobacter haemolyticus]|nr:KAP family NTPase [Acinetobacter haemolyticus]